MLQMMKPILQPYEWWGCMFPPSAVSRFCISFLESRSWWTRTSILIHSWINLPLSVTSQLSYPANARVVFIAIIFDIVFYGLLAAYLDKVRFSLSFFLSFFLAFFLSFQLSFQFSFLPNSIYSSLTNHMLLSIYLSFSFYPPIIVNLFLCVFLSL